MYILKLCCALNLGENLDSRGLIFMGFTFYAVVHAVISEVGQKQGGVYDCELHAQLLLGLV